MLGAAFGVLSISQGPPASAQTLPQSPIVADQQTSYPDTPSEQDIDFLNGEPTVVPFQLQANSIILHVMLNGRGPYAFVLDSGAVNFISPALARELGLAVLEDDVAQGIGDRSVQSGAVKIDSVRIGGLVLRNQRFHLIDLPYGAAHGFPERLMGGMGYELFRRLALYIDFDHSRLSCYDGSKFRYTGAGTALPFYFMLRLPVVEGAVDGVAGKFEIDTGAENNLSLNSPFVLRHDLVARYSAHVQGFAGEGIGGRENAYFVRVRKFALGSLEVDSVVTELAEDKAGIGADPSLAGIVGIGVLKRFNITFDYFHSTIYLEKNANFRRPSVFNRAGLAARITAEGVKVASIFTGSPAASSGIVPGDLILSIDGHAGTDLNGPYLFRVFRQRPGTVLRLLIRHGSLDREVRLELHNLL